MRKLPYVKREHFYPEYNAIKRVDIVMQKFTVI